MWTHFLGQYFVTQFPWQSLGTKGFLWWPIDSHILSVMYQLWCTTGPPVFVAFVPSMDRNICFSVCPHIATSWYSSLVYSAFGDIAAVALVIRAARTSNVVEPGQCDYDSKLNPSNLWTYEYGDFTNTLVTAQKILSPADALPYIAIVWWLSSSWNVLSPSGSGCVI